MQDFTLTFHSQNSSVCRSIIKTAAKYEDNTEKLTYSSVPAVGPSAVLTEDLRHRRNVVLVSEWSEPNKLIEHVGWNGSEESPINKNCSSSVGRTISKDEAASLFPESVLRATLAE